MSETLEELRAKRQALAAAKAKRDAEAQALEAIEAEKQGLVDDEALEAAEQEHGSSYVHGETEPTKHKLAVVRTPYGSVIVKRAEPIVWSRFIRAGKTTEKELSDLVHPSLVHPTKADFAKLCESQPMTLTSCANAIAEMAGARAGEVRGK